MCTFCRAVCMHFTRFQSNNAFNACFFAVSIGAPGPFRLSISSKNSGGNSSLVLAEPLKPSIPPTTSNVSSPRKHLKHIVGYPIPRVFPSLWLLMIWVSCLTGFWNQGQCLPEHARYGNNIVISTTSTQVTRSPRPQERVFHCVSV